MMPPRGGAAHSHPLLSPKPPFDFCSSRAGPAGLPSLLRVSTLWAPSPWEPQPPLAAGGGQGAPGTLPWRGPAHQIPRGPVGASVPWERGRESRKVAEPKHRVAHPWSHRKADELRPTSRPRASRSPRECGCGQTLAPSPSSSSNRPECRWPISGGLWKPSCPGPMICSDAPRSCLGSGLTWGSALCPLHPTGARQGPGCWGPKGRYGPEAGGLQASMWLWSFRAETSALPLSLLLSSVLHPWPRWALSRECPAETAPGFSRFQPAP